MDQLLEEFPEDESVSTLTLDSDIEPSGPCCEKCGAPIKAYESLVCKQCGWYASIGSFVEIDKSWEVAADPGLAVESETQDAAKANLPVWAYTLMACAAAIIVESLAVRLLTPSGSALRTTWSLSQLFIGLITFFVCHTYCYLLVMKNEADIKLLDYLLRPIKTWALVIREMPKRGWVCYGGLSGVVAMAMSVLVIGGIPYESLLDWNVKKKAKFNLMGAIMDQANNNEEEDENSLEEAIGDFAGKAELDDKKNKAAKKARKTEDCIIIGYMANQAGEIQTLLLAAEHYAKLSYAGNVRASDIPTEELQALTFRLAANKRSRPFLKVSIDGAIWVKPKFLCRVSYRRRGKQGGLFGAKVEELLGEVAP